jgi:hypothetical protein
VDDLDDGDAAGDDDDSKDPQLSSQDDQQRMLAQPSSRYFNTTSDGYTSDAFFRKLSPPSEPLMATQVMEVMSVVQPAAVPTIQILTLDDVNFATDRSGSSLITDGPPTFSSTTCFPEDEPQLTDAVKAGFAGGVTV